MPFATRDRTCPDPKASGPFEPIVFDAALLKNGRFVDTVAHLMDDRSREKMQAGDEALGRSGHEKGPASDGDAPPRRTG